jgi:transcriptional regulator with XRE-family HTH domain
MEHQELPGEQSIEQANRERVRALGKLLQQKRVSERLSLQRAFEQSGVSAATLSRLERQATMKTNSGSSFITPDMRTITALVHWLGISLDDLIEGTLPKFVVSTPTIREGTVDVAGATHGASIPEIVEAHLRADRNLSPQAAANLAIMFDLAYRQYAQMSELRQPVEQPPEAGGDQAANDK